MKIDGIELLRMFEKGEVNNKTKIRCIDWVTDSWTEVHFNQKGILKWDVSNIALTQEHLKHHFEIIEEEQDIEELNIPCNFKCIKNGMTSNDREQLDFNFKNIEDKINELIKAVNELKNGSRKNI